MLDGLPLWAGLALLGGLAQTTRNATAQTISRRISPTLNSWSRFAFCLPWAAIAVVATAPSVSSPSIKMAFK